MSILDYIQKIKRLCNSLATIREPVSRKDKLICMFNGLDFEYNAFVTSMNNQFDLPNLEEIHSLFFSYEFRLKQQHTIMQANNVQIHAHTAQTQLTTSHHNKNHFKNPSHFSNSIPHFFVPPTLTMNSFHPSILCKPQENPLIHNQPLKSINSLNGRKPECQICGKFGHTTLVCYHRANLHYQPPSLKNLTLPSLLIPHFQHPLLGLVLLLHLLL